MTRKPRANAVAAELSTPRAAGIAGIVFALSLGGIVVLLHLAMPADGSQSAWIADESRRLQVSRALMLLPYSGIAFLWFIGVIRARLGDREDKLFATAFLGSGLILVAMLFTAGAAIGTLLHLSEGSVPIPDDEVILVSSISVSLLTTYGIRMAAVFTLVVTNLGRRTGIIPRWLQVVGYLAALVLLFAPTRTLWAVLMFPAWVLLLSVEILLASGRSDSDALLGSEPARG